MSLKEVKLQYTQITNDNKQTFYLHVFEHTELQNKGYMALDTLEQAFKYDVGYKLHVYDWNEDSREMERRELRFNFKALIKECAEVKKFAVEYFPQFVI